MSHSIADWRSSWCLKRMRSRCWRESLGSDIFRTRPRKSWNSWNRRFGTEIEEDLYLFLRFSKICSKDFACSVVSSFNLLSLCPFSSFWFVMLQQTSQYRWLWGYLYARVCLVCCKCFPCCFLAFVLNLSSARSMWVRRWCLPSLKQLLLQALISL